MNFEEAPSVHVPREFVAVILAGAGDSLHPITGEFRGEPCPKALLPIGNRPMLSYVLSWIEDSSITDVIIACPSTHRTAISNFVDSDASSLKIVVHPFDQASRKGTCLTLRHLAPQLAQYNCDFVLLPCDIIPPSSLPLESILNRYRVDRSTDGTLLTSLMLEYRPPEKEKGAFGADAWSLPGTPAPIIYDAKSSTLLHVESLEDKNANDEEFEIKTGILWKYPRVRLSRNFVDAHVYIFARPVLDLIAQKPVFRSFREDFIPWLCKVHYQRTKSEKYKKVLKNVTNAPTYSSSLALQHSSTNALSPFKRNRRAMDNSESIASGLTTQPSSPTPTAEEPFPSDPSSRCGVVFHRASAGFAARAHNLWNFMELNRETNRLLQPTRPPPDRSFVDPTSSTGDSLIGESSKIGERSSVKKSVIGKHCSIGKNVVIANSVVLDHCVIEDGAKLDGCILGNNTHVGEKGELVHCVTQGGHEVRAGASIKNRRLENSNWIPEAPSDLSDDSEEGEPESERSDDDEDEDEDEDEDDDDGDDDDDGEEEEK